MRSEPAPGGRDAAFAARNLRVAGALAGLLALLMFAGIAAISQVPTPAPRASLSRPLPPAARSTAYFHERGEEPAGPRPRRRPEPSGAPAPARATPEVARVPEPATESLPESAPSPPPSAEPPAPRGTEQARASLPASEPAPPRRVPRSALSAWSKPGLCEASADAAHARETVVNGFRLQDLGERGKFYFDPRLPSDSEAVVVGFVDTAAETVGRQLALFPPRPAVFVYADPQLMRAAACINGDAVAFYDGALHIAANRADVLKSVIHEYTHHALFSANLIGPAWAQEGIAMHVAGEGWWRDATLLRQVVDEPFDLEAMDRSIAYKLAPPQALEFYVQSALLVECVIRERNWRLRELFDTLRAGSGADASSYDLPELQSRSFLRGCVQNLPR